MFKAGLISCWNKKQNTEDHLRANNHHGFDLKLSTQTKLLCENCCFIGFSVNMTQKDIGILKLSYAKYVKK